MDIDIIIFITAEWGVFGNAIFLPGIESLEKLRTWTIETMKTLRSTEEWFEMVEENKASGAVAKTGRGIK